MDQPQLRILMFSDAYGGLTNTFIRNEVEHLATHHRLKYIALANETPDTAYDVEVIPWPHRPLWDRVQWRLWQADLSCSFRHSRFAGPLRAAITRFRPNVIHCQFGYEALRLLQNIDVSGTAPVLVHFHGYDASEMLRKRSYIRALRPFLEVPSVWPIVVSDYMKGELAAVGLNMTRVRVLRCGIDDDLFQQPAQRVEQPHDKKIIVQISSVIPKKGHRETLLAIASMFVRNPSLRDRVVYRIAGDGPRLQSVRDMARELGVAANVEFLGRITPAQAVELLSHADAFVHHSIEDERGHKEGIPTAIMEAMAMELPVLSTRHAGIPELIEHGVHGLLCDEKDIETFSRQIEEILAWGRRPANRSRIKTEYNKQSHNEMLERIYREIIAVGDGHLDTTSSGTNL